MSRLSGSPKPENFKADVVILLDSSRPISDIDFLYQKQFVRSLAKSLNVFSGTSRVAVINYGSRPKQEIKFGSFKSEEDLKNLLNSIKAQGGARRFDFALQDSIPMLQKARPDLPKIVILVTGGRNAYPNSDIFNSTSKLIHKLGARIFTITVGQKHLESELYSLAHAPSDIIEAEDFDSLRSMGQEIGQKIITSSGKNIFC